MKTRAALVKEPKGKFLVEHLHLGELRPGEVMVKIEGAGICHTDLMYCAAVCFSPGRRLSQ